MQLLWRTPKRETDQDSKVNKRTTRSSSKSLLTDNVTKGHSAAVDKSTGVASKKLAKRKSETTERNGRTKPNSTSVEFNEEDNIVSMTVDRRELASEFPASGEEQDFNDDDSEIDYDSEDEIVSSSKSGSRSSSRSRGQGHSESPSDCDQYSSDNSAESGQYSSSSQDSPPPKRAKKRKSKALKGKVKRMQNYLVKKGLVESKVDDRRLKQLMAEESEDEARKQKAIERKSRKRGKKKSKKNMKCQFDSHPDACRSPSEVTIYKRAIPNISKSDLVKKLSIYDRSPLSDDGDSRFVDQDLIIPDPHDINLFVDRSRRRTGDRRRGRTLSRSRSRSRSRNRKEYRKRSRDRSISQSRRDRSRDRSRQRHYSRSASRSVSKMRESDRNFDLEADRHADDLIKEAERAKAKMYEVPGKKPHKFISKTHAFIHSALVDQNYLTVAAHVNKPLKEKIQNFEYVDFSKLLPRDKLAEEEDDRLVWINKGGYPVMVPAADRESQGGGGITSLNKWDQAFRVYSDILTTKHPEKINELLQYSHVIATAAQTYVWDNVYSYDKAFRIHISEYPARSWGVILQQAWNMRLNDRVRRDAPSYSGGKGYGGRKEECKKFQRGKCTYGINCIYDHRCTLCNKWGHGAHICRKRSGYNDGDGKKPQQRYSTSTPSATQSRPTSDQPPPYRDNKQQDRSKSGTALAKTSAK